MEGCNIAIIGAGTAGLASALYLARDGHRITIFEQFDTPKPVGAGLMLQPTGLACLAVLGLDKTVIANSRIINRIDGRTIRGRRVLDIGYDALGANAFGLGVHRATLFGALYNAVQSEDIKLLTSTMVRDTPLKHEARSIVGANGAYHGPFDCIIDASGARSHLRSLHADVRYVKPYPYGAVWGVCNEPTDWPWPDILAQRFDAARHMLGILPLGQRNGAETSQMAFFWSLPANSYDTWRDNGIDAWHAQVAAYWPEAGALAQQFPSPDAMTFATYPDVVLKQLYSERMVFLGDAAHSTSPQLGQGANLALADALTFAKAVRTAESFEAALMMFARDRKAHLRFYQVASRYLTPFFQSDSRLAAGLRDASFGPMTMVPYIQREMVRSLAGVKNGIFTSLDPGDWHERYAGMRV